jgi:hypothetical protein
VTRIFACFSGSWLMADEPHPFAGLALTWTAGWYLRWTRDPHKRLLQLVGNFQGSRVRSRVTGKGFSTDSWFGSTAM